MWLQYKCFLFNNCYWGIIEKTLLRSWQCLIQVYDVIHSLNTIWSILYRHSVSENEMISSLDSVHYQECIFFPIISISNGAAKYCDLATMNLRINLKHVNFTLVLYLFLFYHLDGLNHVHSETIQHWGFLYCTDISVMTRTIFTL